MVATIIPMQDSQDFHGRYGEPDSERFTARPGISVSVAYGPDHQACQILVEPPRSLLYAEDQLPLMSSEAVTEIIEEIAPDDARGKETNKILHVSAAMKFT
jgi:hypothetical protein